MSVDIEFDPDKRDRTLAERGLDFACAREVFAGPHLDWPDTRIDYGEDRLHHIWRAGRMHGRDGVDATRRSTPHHQYEESQ